MTREEQAIVYFKDMRKRMCEDHLEICPKDSVAYRATLIEKGFYDAAIKALEQESVPDKIRAEIIKYEGDCRLSVDEYPSCKQCTDNVFETIYGFFDKYKHWQGITTNGTPLPKGHEKLIAEPTEKEIDKLYMNKMPKSCKECPLTYLDSGDDAYFGATERRCVIDDSCIDGMVSERAYACPLVEAIPKADYENRLKADMVVMLEEMQKAIGKAFGNEDDSYHMQMFTEDELEEIADHLYAVVKRARKEQDNDSSNLDNSDM